MRQILVASCEVRFGTCSILRLLLISGQIVVALISTCCDAGNEIKQILQGVTEWVATMVDDNSDPFGDLATFEKSGQMTAITAHVAEVISQMAGTLNGLGANDDLDVEITYEFDLAVSHCICNFSAA